MMDQIPTYNKGRMWGIALSFLLFAMQKLIIARKNLLQL